MSVDHWARRLYVLAFLVTGLSYVLVVEPFQPGPAVSGKNRVLEMNAALLVAAFALVVTVFMVVAQLASGMGIARAVRPVRRLLREELAGFAFAIGITLLARWAVPESDKNWLTHVSSFLTLFCLVVLAPYFWHQRQHISTREVIDDAFSRSMKGGTLSDPTFMDVLVGAAKRGDYLLFRDGIQHLCNRAATGAACREYLEGIENHLSDGHRDGYALEIVRSALSTLNVKSPKDTGV